MSEGPWLIEDVTPLTDATVASLQRALPTGRREARGGLTPVGLAIRLNDIVIHDNKKWFGGADVRLDALVVHGHMVKGKPHSTYMPQTFRFPHVRDGDRLPTAETGLLIFYGRPRYFLDLFVMASRDRKDSDDLATLLAGSLGSSEMQGAIGTLLGLTTAAPHVAAVTGALGAAATIGNFAYQVLSRATGNTVGLLRANQLQHRDGFGVGRHPKDGSYRERDLSFWYEIVLDEKAPDPA